MAVVGGGIATAIMLPEYAMYARTAIVGGCTIMGMSMAGMSKYDAVFKALKLGHEEAYPILVEKKNKGSYTKYIFTLPAGMSVEKFRDKQNEIEQYMGKSIEIEYGHKNIIIKEYKDKAKTLIEYLPQKLNGDVPIMAGYARDGKLISIDLAEGEPHMYVAGSTGSGKSTALRAIITNLILYNDIDLYLIDLKNGAEFGMFEQCEKVIGYASDDRTALQLLQKIMGEVERRYKVMSKAKCTNIKEYNRHNQSIKYQLLVIDELATLIYDKPCIALLEQLTAKARAAGIHILIATQRPDKDVLNGRIKANVTTVLGLKTINAINSMVVIDHDGLERLRGKGHGILRHGVKEHELQCPYLSEDRAKELIAPHIIDKPTPKAGQPIEVDFAFLDEL